jgi:hypothetical protein
MTMGRLVKWVTFLAIFAMATRISMDTDTWWHLRAGQWIVEHQALLRTDLFSYTRYGQPWHYPGWLVEIPMYGIYKLLGPGGLNLWTGLMVTVAFGFVWLTMRGGVFIRAFVIILAAAASGVYWAARPYLITFVLAAVFLWALEDYRWKRNRCAKNRLWWLLLWMVVWANSHGGFLVGFMLWGVYWGDALLGAWLGKPVGNDRSAQKDYFWQLTRVGVGLVMAVCVNPFGPIMLLYPFKTVGIGALRAYIQEWQSPDFHQLQVQPFLWLVLLTLTVVGFSRRRLIFTDLALTLLFAYLGFVAGRNVALFGLVAPMVITRHSAPMTEAISRRLGFRLDAQSSTSRSRKIVNLLILGVILLAVTAKISLVIPAEPNFKYFQANLPVAAINFIQREHPQGELFNSYNWGGYLLWSLPEYRVFVDGRTDLYSDEIISQWLRVVRAEDGWQQVLTDWGVKLILLEPGTPVVVRLPSEGWRLLYQDNIAVLYGR